MFHEVQIYMIWKIKTKAEREIYSNKKAPVILNNTGLPFYFTLLAEFIVNHFQVLRDHLRVASFNVMTFYKVN